MGFTRALQSSIGAKSVMAVTGIALVLFLVGHMLANLQVFWGPEPLNAYGHKLRETPGLLWTARLLLLAAVLLHIVAAVRVTRGSRAARPEKYAVQKTRVVSYAARTLMLSGVFIALYVVYHLLHFTTRTVHDEHSHGVDAQQRHDVYAMVVGSFQNPWIAGVYIVAMLLLSLHVSHGIGSLVQTLGLGHPRYHPSLRYLGPATAAVIAIGFILVPLAIQLGWVGAGGH